MLSVVFRMDGCHFAGACQLLSPNAVSKEQASEAASSLVSILHGRLPHTAVEKVNIPHEAYSFREYRTPTKHLLAALGNSLQQAMPSGFSFQSTKPSNPLRAAGPDARRVEFDDTEKALLTPRPPPESRMFFLWASSTGESKPDYYTNEAFVRVTFAADEGTVSMFFYILVFGCRASLAGSAQDMWILMWPDVFHKSSRKCSNAIRRLDQGSNFLRRLTGLFRFSRGPFKSSRFGRTIADARDRLTELLETNPEHEFVQLFLPGMAKDAAGLVNCGHCAQESYGVRHALDALKKRQGLLAFALM